MLLSSAYLPPASYFTLLARDMTLSPDRVIPSYARIEACESYLKQSYRNRTYILAGDGIAMLQVPVVHNGASIMKDVLIDYSTDWVTRTERALDAAYFHSAFFEYYREELYGLLESGEARLLEYNTALTKWCAAKCHISTELSHTEEFTPPGSIADDYRYSLHPKRPCPIPEKEHYQVFAERMGGFTPRLSILDLLFNEGPDALSYL